MSIDHIGFGVLRISDQKIIKTMDYGDGKSRILILSWQPDSRTLNFVLDNDDKTTLWQQAINEDSPHRVADLGGEDIESFSVAPDGKSFAFTRGSWLHDAVLITGLK
jgi:Tol biopolymer transport system component